MIIITVSFSQHPYLCITLIEKQQPKAVLDASKEEARREMREIEDAFIQGRSREWRFTREMDRRAWRQDHLTPSPRKNNKRSHKGKGKGAKVAKKLPDGCIDILVEDHEAEEEEHTLERERSASYP